MLKRWKKRKRSKAHQLSLGTNKRIWHNVGDNQKEQKQQIHTDLGNGSKLRRIPSKPFKTTMILINCTWKTINHSWFHFQCQRGLAVTTGGGNPFQCSAWAATRAQTEVQGTRHHLTRRPERAHFIQENQDSEWQIQEPQTEGWRLNTLTFTFPDLYNYHCLTAFWQIGSLFQLTGEKKPYFEVFFYVFSAICWNMLLMVCPDPGVYKIGFFYTT